MTRSEADERPELSSLASALDDIIDRLEAIGSRRVGNDPDDALAIELMELDRLLRGAARRLSRLLRAR